MYDYTSFQASFKSFQNPSQTNGSQWKPTQRITSTTNPAKLPREISDELTQRFTMRQKTLAECKTGPSIEMIKRKFEIETPQPKPKSTPSVVSFKKSSHVINNTLEESYWAQWKPTNSSFITNDVKNESFGKGRSQFTVNSVSNRCNADSLTLCEGKKLLEEKSLKVLRKPMAMTESNSSEGDKNVKGKLFLCNPCDNPVNQNNSECYQNYQQPYPTFTASMPNYHSIFYYGPSDHNYHERVKPCKRKESNKRCVKQCDDPENYQKDNQQNNCRDEYKKRPKSGVEKKEEKCRRKVVKCKLSISNQEICKNHVRFCSKKYHGEINEESESCCSGRDSTRTIEGYHGDIDTESQVDTRKFNDHNYEDQEDTQESKDFHDNEDYPCYCHCCNKTYWVQDYNYNSQSDNVSENSYLYNPYNYQVYRYEEETHYPNNHYSPRDKNDSNSSFHYNQLKDSSYSSTSRMSSSNPQIKKRMNQRGRNCATQSPVSRTACACNTEPKVCANKSCETAENITKEKKIGDDSPPGGLKVIKEKPETLVVSSTSRSDEYDQRHKDGCKCCSAAPCNESSTGTSTSSSKSSTPSSKDTIAVAVGSSKDNIQDETSFVMDDVNQCFKEKKKSQSTQKFSKVPECTCVSSGTFTDPVSNKSSNNPAVSGVVNSRINTPRESFKEKRFEKKSEKQLTRDESNITPPSWRQPVKKDSDPENFCKGKTSAGAALYKNGKSQTADSDPNSTSQSRSIKTGLNLKSGNNNNSKPGYTQTARDGNGTLESRPSSPQSPIVRSINPSAVPSASSRPATRTNSGSPRSEVAQVFQDQEKNFSRSGGTKPRSHSGATPTGSIRGRSPSSNNTQPNNPSNSRPGSAYSGNPNKATSPNPSVPQFGGNSIEPGTSSINHSQPKHFITDSTQTVSSINPPIIKSTATYPVIIQRGFIANNSRKPPSANSGTTQSIITGSTYTGSAIPESIYNEDRPRSVSPGMNVPRGAGTIDGIYVPEKNIPTQNAYTESITAGNQAAGRPLSAYMPGIHNDYKVTKEESVDRNLKHGRSYDGLRHYKTYENEIAYRIDTTNQDLNERSPEVQRDDTNYGDSYEVCPSESKNLGYITTPKSLILQRNPRYMPLRGHTYTLKTPSNSCSRSWRSPKRKR